MFLATGRIRVLFAFQLILFQYVSAQIASPTDLDHFKIREDERKFVVDCMEQSGIYAECYEDGIPYRFQRGNQANTFACVCRTFHAIACMDRSRGIALPDSCEESWMGKLEGMVDTHCYDWQFTYVTRNPDAPKSTASTTTSPEASGGNKPTPSVDQPSSTGEGQIQSISIEETDRPAASSESSEKASSDEGQELATTETELVPEESSGANASSTAPISSTTDATDNPTSIK